MWKFQDFSLTHISRKINFAHFEAPKTAILTIWLDMIFEFLETFNISKFKASKIVKSAFFDLLKSAKIDFT